MKSRLRVYIRALLILACGLIEAPSARALDLQDQSLNSLSDLDNFVEAACASLSNDACIYPEGPYSFAINCGYLSFADGSDVAALTNSFNSATIFGVPVYPVTVFEIQDTSRVWLYMGTNGVAFRTNAVPTSFNPEAWVRTAFRHDPPDYLTGTYLDQWYADRDRSRMYLMMTLVNSNDWETLVAAERAAASTNLPAETPPPKLPADTNQLAIVGIHVSQTNSAGLWLYTPSNRPVAVLTRSTLTAPVNAWSLLGSLDAVSPFAYWETAVQASACFYLAGYSDADSDNDNIPDFLEMYVFGTNPDSADSDGDGISDYNEVYVFGTDPWNPDASPPVLLVVTPAAGEWKAVLP